MARDIANQQEEIVDFLNLPRSKCQRYSADLLTQMRSFVISFVSALGEAFVAKVAAIWPIAGVAVYV